MNDIYWNEAPPGAPAMIAYGHLPGQVISIELAQAMLSAMYAANPGAFGRQLVKAIVAQAGVNGSDG